MPSLFFLRLNTADQPDFLFCSEQVDKLDLDKVKSALVEKEAPVGERGTITGEGFKNIVNRVRQGENLLEFFCASQGSLGYFNEARIENDSVIAQRIQHQYYSKSTVMLTEQSQVIIKFDNTIDETARTKVKSLIESIGFEATAFRIDDSLLRKIQSSYKWSAVKLDKIEKRGDSTRRVSYEVDLANDNGSGVDEDYREYGQMSHLTFEIPFSAQGAPNTVTVKLYNQGNRIVIDDNQIADPETFNDFVVYLLKTLEDMKKKSVM